MTPLDAAFITGAVAALIAIWGVLSQRQIARRRATLDYIATSKSNRELIAARRTFIELAKASGGLAVWAEEDKEKTPEALNIGEVLNQYELISLGIQFGILDYKFYRMLSRGVTLRFWNHGHPYIVSLRSRLKDKMIYHEFEEMIKWLNDEKVPKRHWWWGKFF
jgi:Domain of unknown function (DUF4760)